jgi:hypothetical protein
MEGGDAQGGFTWVCGVVAGLNGGIAVDRGGKLLHVHVAVQKATRDTTLLRAWKESN